MEHSLTIQQKDFDRALASAKKRGLEYAANYLRVRAIEESFVNDKLGQIIERLAEELDDI